MLTLALMKSLSINLFLTLSFCFMWLNIAGETKGNLTFFGLDNTSDAELEPGRWELEAPLGGQRLYDMVQRQFGNLKAL